MRFLLSWFNSIRQACRRRTANFRRYAPRTTRCYPAKVFSRSAMATLALLAAGCSNGASHGPSATPQAIATAEATATVEASSTASPAPTHSPDLLTFERGTFVRKWSVGASGSPAQALTIGQAYDVDPAFRGVPELVFELPAIARVSQITATASLPSGASVQLHVAAATTDDRSYADVGTIALNTASGTSATGSLQGPLSARWLRVRFDRPSGTQVRIQSLAASGDVDAPALKFSGRWSPTDTIMASDSTFGGVKGTVPDGAATTGNDQLATVERYGRLIAATCTYLRDVWRGPIEGGSAHLDNGGTLTVIAGGSLLVGTVEYGSPILARRIAHAPACDPPGGGRGTEIAFISRYPEHVLELTTPNIVPGHRYETRLLPLLSSDDLHAAATAVLAMSCAPDKDADAAQRQALLDFVARGHVLLVRDADYCSKSEYGFIPYPFTTSATGAQGARGSVLTIADSSILGSSDASDRQHYVDTAAYLKNYLQQLGDADIMQTSDPHWCGLVFAKNLVGTSGWVRAYARYGKGIIVYDGFDADDLRSQIPQAIEFARLAYDLSPSADLPCSAHVASQLILLASAHRTLSFGGAQDLRFSFRVDREGNQAPGPITMTLDGEPAPGWHASVDRRAFTLGASEQRVNVSIHVPANASPTRHLYTLTAAGNGGQSAQASIELDVTEPLVKELVKGGRARIYGIHFDVASARIQSRSESVEREIGVVLRSHPAWRMRVEGYTDSDGGAAYNLALSQRRAQAVVNDLVVHYDIKRSRLKAAGYGLMHPVASNGTDAGKALNRRVELVRW